MCKSIVLSNLPVHLEQAPERGTFFSPDSPEELAAKLEGVYATFDPDVEAAYASKRADSQVDLERSWIGDFARIMKTVTRA